MTAGRIRVRFAPSPTGLLHVGNARTALYNWLFARGAGGDLILRIEDTDRERSEPQFEAQLIEDLHWLGLGWDEGPGLPGEAERGSCGPYRQSGRLEIYARHTEQLLREGKAYRCFCTPEELERERADQAGRHAPQVYSGRCRSLSPGEAAGNLAKGRPFAVRLRIGPEPLRFHDLVRGDVEFPPEALSDPVLVRSGRPGEPGIPVYNYVATIDDALMGITHVIRGDDHISNTPRQVAVYRAFGWSPPHFAHLSTILGKDRERLSKRHGATSIASFRAMGYLPEALVNYLALLGWGAEDGRTETFTLTELARVFTLERVTASPAVFDFDKLNWLNRHYIKASPPARLAELGWQYFEGVLPPREDAPGEVRAWFVGVVELFAPAVDRLDQLGAKSGFLFGLDPEEVRRREDNAPVLASPGAGRVLAELGERARAHSGAVTPELFRDWMNEVRAATGVKGRELYHPVRIALTGSPSGPEFDRLLPVIEEGAALGIGVPGVRERLERFQGD